MQLMKQDWSVLALMSGSYSARISVERRRNLHSSELRTPNLENHDGHHHLLGRRHGFYSMVVMASLQQMMLLPAFLFPGYVAASLVPARMEMIL